MPIKDGIEVKVKDAYMVAGQWTLLIRLDEPVMPPEFFRFVTKFKGNVANDNTMGVWQRQWKQRLDVLYQHCRWWRSDPNHETLDGRRQKRGLLNIIGKAANFLFGTATSVQIKDIHNSLREIGSNQQKIVSDLNRCVTVVNHNTAVISKLKNYLVFLQREFLRYTAFYDQKLRVLEKFGNRLTVRQDIEVTLGNLEEIGSEFLTAHDYWLYRKDNLEAGQLTESLLPTEVL